MATKPKAKAYSNFVKDLGARESAGAGDYLAKNMYGYLGRYQFGLARLSDFGICVRRPGHTGSDNKDFDWVPPYSEAVFLCTPELQDSCFDVHVGRYRGWVLVHFSSVLGETRCGVAVTLSGAIACCHLVGPGGLVRFMKNVDPEDANGTKASEYVKKFGGYEIPDDLPTMLKPRAAQGPDVA